MKIAAISLVVLIVASTYALADAEPWAIYVQDHGNPLCRGFADSSAAGQTVPSASSGIGLPRLLRPTNWPGKPLPIDAWLKHPGSWAKATASGSIGMYAVEMDSCWEDTSLRNGRPCNPTIALCDTTGLIRATFPSARDPVWSPNGKTLAFRTIEYPIRPVEEGSVMYWGQPRDVTFIRPESGKSWSYPAATDILSWVDDETLLLELQGRRYFLHSSTGTISPAWNVTEPTIMRGLVSPDHWYVYRPGTLRVWCLVGRVPHYGHSEVDTTLDAPEGVDVDLSGRLLGVLGASPDYIAKGSFWVRGSESEHDLCIGVGWRTNEWTRRNLGAVKCEVLVVDVHKGIVRRRIEGSFIASAEDGKTVVVWQKGQSTFVRLARSQE